VAAVDAVPGLAIESLILVPFALGWLVWMRWQGADDPAIGAGAGALLVLSGILTALPLVGFAYGARRLPYSMIGVLQYIAPTLQLLCGVLLLGESFDRMQAVGFGCIWLALILYAVDGWRRARRARRQPQCDSHVPAGDGAAPVCASEPEAELALASSAASHSSSEPSLMPSNRNVDR
jgi:chloramphenicol-sensitive protein RarD